MQVELQNSASPPELTRQQTTVLVVDDDEDLLEITEFALRSEGFSVETAHTGEEALALLRAGDRPSLVLLDLMMPVMDGWKFLDEVAHDPALSHIPVVVMTAAQFFDVPPGAVACLRKPAPLRLLVDTIERHRPTAA